MDIRIAAAGDVHAWLNREWLLSSGTGGYASGTFADVNTRRYHGLLVMAGASPIVRVMALNRLAIRVKLGDRTVDLSSNWFGDTLHPKGVDYLRRFECDTKTACWTWQVDDLSISRRVRLVPGADEVRIEVEVQGVVPREVELECVPFLSMRGFHSLRNRNDLDPSCLVRDRELIARGAGREMVMSADRGTFITDGQWWYDHTYPVDRERGQDFQEDLFTPGFWRCRCSRGERMTIIASARAVGRGEWPAEVAVAEPATDPIETELRQAARAFVVRRRTPAGQHAFSVLAGFPWFGDWGRDTMISLPGLMLVTGRLGEALDVLRLFAQYESEGMIPNHFDDYTDAPSYNTVDASLWFVHACHEYLRHGGDKKAFADELRPACQRVITGYERGTRYGIRMESDGLITAGDKDTQLTWMDARCNDVSFTPRHGKAVEINALWYHAICLMGKAELAKKVARSFVARFVRGDGLGLYDVITGTSADASVRPNQLLAASLAHSPLGHSQRRKVVSVVRDRLLTPYGVATLDPADPRFKGEYRGGAWDRDGAYHNGIVWPWLWGPFVEAYLRSEDHSPAARRQVRQWLAPITRDLFERGCAGQLAEIYESRAPWRPVGCFAQAWSVAEVLRAWVMSRP